MPETDVAGCGRLCAALGWNQMSRFCGLTLVCASVALGQGFSGLATNRDGSVLYFSSAARMKGTTQYLHGKIFRWDSANGVRLFEQRANDLVPFPLRDPQFLGSIYYYLSMPDVSSDGSVLSFIGARNCLGFSTCLQSWLVNQTTIYALNNPAGKPATLLTPPGFGALSPNGRYVVASTPTRTIPTWPVAITVEDLQTGQATQYRTGSGLRSNNKRWVANDGTIVYTTADGLALANGTQLQAIPGSSGDYYAMVNDAATLLVFERFDPVGHLSVCSLKDGSTRDLVTGTKPAALSLPQQFGASMSYDGSQIAFLYGTDQQVYVIGSDGSGLRQVTHFGQAVREVVLSGDGTVAFATTADNRLMRIDVGTGDSSELVPATPYVSGVAEDVSRGSLSGVVGSGFATQSQQATAPYPLTLNGVELHIQGAPIPLASVAPDSIGYAIPWDLPDGSFEIEIWVSAFSASPFVPGVEQWPETPAAYVTHAVDLVAAHEDFSSTVSATLPAKPGEILHLYARDLGVVASAPPPGMPAPLAPLSFLVPPISCAFWNNSSSYPPSASVPIEVLFAGLAPTFLGLFQVDIRMPASFAGPGGVSCQIGDPASGYGIGGYLYLSPNP